MRTRMIIAICLFLPALLQAQEEWTLSMPFRFSNGRDRVQALTAGVAEGATAGLDWRLGERELPPRPPSSVFDARFVGTQSPSDLGEGSFTDLRPIARTDAPFTLRYTVAYQAGDSAGTPSLAWDPAHPGRIAAIAVNDVDVTRDTIVRFPAGSGRISIDLTFVCMPVAFTAQPPRLSFMFNPRDSFPSAVVDVVPSVDSMALWGASSAASWLRVTPGGATGRHALTVAVSTSLLPAGMYRDSVLILSADDSGRLAVPVDLEVLPVEAAAAPPPAEDYLEQYYPNPVARSGGDACIVLHASGRGALTALLRDAAGRIVATVLDEARLLAGEHILRLDAAGLTPGWYALELRTRAGSMMRPLVVVR